MDYQLTEFESITLLMMEESGVSILVIDMNVLVVSYRLEKSEICVASPFP